MYTAFGLDNSCQLGIYMVMQLTGQTAYWSDSLVGQTAYWSDSLLVRQLTGQTAYWSGSLLVRQLTGQAAYWSDSLLHVPDFAIKRSCILISSHSAIDWLVVHDYSYSILEQKDPMIVSFFTHTGRKHSQQVTTNTCNNCQQRKLARY